MRSCNLPVTWDITLLPNFCLSAMKWNYYWPARDISHSDFQLCVRGFFSYGVVQPGFAFNYTGNLAHPTLWNAECCPPNPSVVSVPVVQSRPVDTNQCSAMGFSNTSPRIKLTNLTKQRDSCLPVNATSYYITSFLKWIWLASNIYLAYVVGKHFVLLFCQACKFHWT